MASENGVVGDHVPSAVSLDIRLMNDVESASISSPAFYNYHLNSRAMDAVSCQHFKSPLNITKPELLRPAMSTSLDGEDQKESGKV